MTMDFWMIEEDAPGGGKRYGVTNMKCKFCDCTEHAACSIPYRVFYAAADDGSGGISPLVEPDDQVFLETGVIAQLDPDIEYMPCRWIAPYVCSAPACVEKAYAEARPLAEVIHGLAPLLDSGVAA